MNNTVKSEIIERYKSAANRLILLDYDGTLVNLTAIPHTAVLPEHMEDIILKMVSTRQTTLFIITGRGHEDIDIFLNHIPVNIIAEHGAMMKNEGVWKKQLINNYSWKKEIIPVLNIITSACPNSYVEEKNYSLTWHYRNADTDLGYASSRELIRHLNSVIHAHNLKILDGNKVVEILTNDIGKGKAVEKLFEHNKYDFVLSIGDDATDEEMFGFFLNHPEAVTIKVGEGATQARFILKNIGEVATLLNHMTE